MVIGLVEEEIRDDYCFVVIHLILHFKSKLNSNRQSGVINSFFGNLMARHPLSHLLYLLLSINLIIQRCALAILQPVPFMQRKINLEKKKKKRKEFGERPLWGYLKTIDTQMGYPIWLAIWYSNNHLYNCFQVYLL